MSDAGTPEGARAAALAARFVAYEQVNRLWMVRDNEAPNERAVIVLDLAKVQAVAVVMALRAAADSRAAQGAQGVGEPHPMANALRACAERIDAGEPWRDALYDYGLVLTLRGTPPEGARAKEALLKLLEFVQPRPGTHLDSLFAALDAALATPEPPARSPA